jgi:HNH endonuclease
VVQRIGQDIFRAALMDYWGGRCPITGITDAALLRASHIVPWSECDDAKRLDVHNGLLLSALWDAAFDAGLVSFADDGTALASSELGAAARTALGIDSAPRLSNLRDAHRANLAVHRAQHGFSSGTAKESIPSLASGRCEGMSFLHIGTSGHIAARRLRRNPSAVSRFRPFR